MLPNLLVLVLIMISGLFMCILLFLQGPGIHAT
jgi:hypothetical protein